MTNGTGLETRTARPKVDEGDGRDPTRGGLPASRALLFCGVLTGLAFVGRNSNPHFFSIRIFEDYASALVRVSTPRCLTMPARPAMISPSPLIYERGTNVYNILLFLLSHSFVRGGRAHEKYAQPQWRNLPLPFPPLPFP